MKKTAALLLVLALLLSACGFSGRDGSIGEELGKLFESAEGSDRPQSSNGGETHSATGAETPSATGSESPAESSDAQNGTDTAAVAPGAPKILIVDYYEQRYDYDLNVNFGYGRMPLVYCGDQVGVGGYDAYMEVRDDEAYPELAAALRERSERNIVSMQQSLDNIESYAREDYGYGSYDGADDYNLVYYTVTNAWLSRADGDIVSIRCEYGSFAGGPHPNSGYYGMNFDSKTGKELSIGDILTDVGRERLPGIFEAEMDRTNPYFRQALLVDSVSEEIARWIDEGSLRFVVDYSGVTILVSQYELAAYAAGPLFVKIRFDEYPELFADEYVFHGGDWVTGMPQLGGTSVYNGYDSLTFDTPYGSRELSIRFSDEYYSYGGTSLSIELDGAVWTSGDDFYSYSIKPYLICRGGEYYLYLEHHMPNDWPALYVFDLTGAEPRLLGELYEAPGSNVLTDPDCFFLSTRSYVMSTYTVERRYRIADSGPEKGMPQPLEDMYYATTAPVLTLKEDFVMTELTSGGEHDVSVPRGTRLRFYRTDNDSIVELCDDSGRVYRVSYDPGEDYLGRVSGRKLEEIFDGTMFAG